MHIEDRIKELGTQLLRTARDAEQAQKKSHPWENALMDWCMDNEDLKFRVFRFIDVFPHLKTNEAILKHIHEYFPLKEHAIPARIRAGLLLTLPGVLTQAAVGAISKSLFDRISKLFVAAANEVEAMKVVDETFKIGASSSIDLLGERTVSHEEANEFYLRYESLIESLGDSFRDDNLKNVSVKLSALDPQFNPLETEQVCKRLIPKLIDLLSLAAKNGVLIHFDMEEYALRDLSIALLGELSKQDIARQYGFGLVLQAYLTDSNAVLDEIVKWTSDFKRPLVIRLVRGAYWDQEIMLARDNGWKIPVYANKSHTDANFEILAERILRQKQCVKLACATHNIRSIAFVIAKAEELKKNKDEFEFQFLYGMGYPLMHAVIKEGFTPRMYMPIGDPVPGMAYLVRRLLENISSQSFVRRGIHEKSEPEQLLKNPKIELESITSEADPVVACPLLEFHFKQVRDTFQKQMTQSLKFLPMEIPSVIGGKEIENGPIKYGGSPIDEEWIISKSLMSNVDMVKEAIHCATETFVDWSHVRVSQRAQLIRKAADWLLAKRLELATMVVYEVGKSWVEADADIKEAIDFLNFYADRAIQDCRAIETQSLPNECNYTHLIPRGPTAIIAPWNFPIAILTGMTGAALVSGNTVVIKPAEQSTICGWYVFQAFRAAGIPDGVINFLPGIGSEIGPSLVTDARIATIAFTGSKEVGLEIAERANARQEGQSCIKKLIIEMGGKNAAYVDDTADLDQAVPSILHSAFSYSGQKCSALSRLYVHKDIHNKLIEKLDDATECLRYGSPLDSQTVCGPVIDAASKKKIMAIIDSIEETGRIIARRAPARQEGYYVPIVIAEGIPIDSPIMHEEIFGPVLLIVGVSKIEEAIALANDSKFALTGGIFSRTPSHIEKVRKNLEVGNLYINREITGAIVGRQPFGGYRLSGTGTKAGGYNYLREFCVERTVSENMYRHGYAPFEEKK